MLKRILRFMNRTRVCCAAGPSSRGDRGVAGCPERVSSNEADFEHGQVTIGCRGRPRTVSREVDAGGTGPDGKPVQMEGTIPMSCAVNRVAAGSS